MKISGRTRFRRACSSACKLAALACLLAAAPALNAEGGDATRGRRLLSERRCTMCHAVAGRGPAIGPDLAEVSNRGFTPAALTAQLWNHGPAMWQTMERRGVEVPKLSTQELEDLFAYFFSLWYFNPPGDAGRGKRIFHEKHCVECHSLEDPSAFGAGGALPVSAWPSLADPVLWARQMWNHSGRMARQMAERGIEWPRFEPREMVDLLVFLRTRPNLIGSAALTVLGDPAEGEQVFAAKGCANCHTLKPEAEGKISLAARRGAGRTPASFAAALWNHRAVFDEQPSAQAGPAPFASGEIEDLMAYFLAEGYFSPAGKADRGEKLFRKKGCAPARARDLPCPPPAKPIRRQASRPRCGVTAPICLPACRAKASSGRGSRASTWPA